MHTWPKTRLTVAKSGPQSRFKRISRLLRTLKNKSNSWQILTIWMIWKNSKRLTNRCHQGLLKCSQWRTIRDLISQEVWISKIHHSSNNRWCKMESNLVANLEAKNNNSCLHRNKMETMINLSRKSLKWVIRARLQINTTTAATKWDSNMTYHNKQAIIKKAPCRHMAKTMWMEIRDKNQVWLWLNNSTWMLSWKRQRMFLRRSNSPQRKRRKRKKRRRLSWKRTLITKTARMLDLESKQPLERRLKKNKWGRKNLWSKNVNLLRFKKNSACYKSRKKNFYSKNSNSNSVCRKNSGVKRKKKLKLKPDSVSVWPNKKLRRRKN